MEFPVIHQGKTVGNCCIGKQGLYWEIECRCALISDRVERLYSGREKLGVLERCGDSLHLRRRISRSSVPDPFPRSGFFALTPEEKTETWEGILLGQPVCCLRDADELLFPYEETKPCPCEALICFFTVEDGFWHLPLRKEWTQSVREDSLGT